MSLYDVFSEQFERTLPMLSLTIGIVSSIEDPENLGRVKVKLINRSTSEFETDFIRTMTPMSGKECGFYFLPDIGDEVLVGFSDGDIHRPYVLGCLWNSENKHPEKIEDNKNDIRLIKTKTGHTITFNEKKDKEAIVITTAQGMTISLEDKETIITISDKEKKNSIVLDAKNKEVNITGESNVNIKTKECSATFKGADITMTAKGKLVLEGQDINLNAKNNVSIVGAAVKIEAKSSAEIKANAKIDITASGPANIKGAIVKIN